MQNLSLGGLMLSTPVALRVGDVFGCEFTVFGSPLIDMPAVVVSRIGEVYSARFQAGPISEILIQGAMDDALATGNASVLSIHDLHGRKLMRIAGGLNNGLRGDFMHGLTRGGVSELDLSGVTSIDSAGLALCLIATRQHEVKVVRCSPCFDAAWQQAGNTAPA